MSGMARIMPAMPPRAEPQKNTATMIEESVKRSENGVQIAARVGAALEEITTGTSKVNSLLSEIASASSEQATGIGQVNQSVGEIDRMTQQNAALVEESAAAADSLREQAARLSQVVQQFRLADDGPAAMALARPTLPGIGMDRSA